MTTGIIPDVADLITSTVFRKPHMKIKVHAMRFDLQVRPTERRKLRHNE